MPGDDIVYSEDKPCLEHMSGYYNEHQLVYWMYRQLKIQTSISTVDGRQLSNNVYIVDELVEKLFLEEAPSYVAILGRYIMNSSIFDILTDTKPGKGREIQLTYALKFLAKGEDMGCYDFEGKRYDVGNK